MATAIAVTMRMRRMARPMVALARRCYTQRCPVSTRAACPTSEQRQSQEFFEHTLPLRAQRRPESHLWPRGVDWMYTHTSSTPQGGRRHTRAILPAPRPQGRVAEPGQQRFGHPRTGCGYKGDGRVSARRPVERHEERENRHTPSARCGAAAACATHRHRSARSA